MQRAPVGFTHIYVLIDPRSGLVRYVGRSVSPHLRISGHIADAKNMRDVANKGKWLRSLLKAGKRPIVAIVDTVPESLRDEHEIWWVAAYRRQGVRLVNSCDGGGGIVGYKHSPERIAKFTASLRGKCKSYEHRRNISNAKLGTKWTPLQRSSILKARGESLECMSRNTVGVRNPRAVITEADVQEIRRLAAERSIKQSVIAARYGIKLVTVEKIVARKIWKHVA